MFKDLSWFLASVFPTVLPLGKLPLNVLHGLVPERSALFSVTGVLESLFPIFNYVHGAVLSTHNEQLSRAHFPCRGCIMEKSQKSDV